MIGWHGTESGGRHRGIRAAEYYYNTRTGDALVAGRNAKGDEDVLPQSYGVIVNTSFNVRGEPIVCAPQDAYRCFMRTEVDYLVMGNYMLDKCDQPKFTETAEWKTEFKLD